METAAEKEKRLIEIIDRRALRRLGALPGKKKSSSSTTATRSLITTGKIKSKPSKIELIQPHTLSKSGKPTRSLTHEYDPSIFGSYEDPDYVRAKKKKIADQTPPAKTIKSTITGAETVVTKSGEKRHPISRSTGIPITGLAEFDHIVPKKALSQKLAPVSRHAPEFVKKKWKVREGGTNQLTPEQYKEISLSPTNTQILSAAENEEKSDKRLHDYKKGIGWGTDMKPQAFEPKKQAQSYHDALVEVARNYGKRGLMTREEGQAYREITGKEPDPILDAGMGSQYSPPSNKRNITGFDVGGDTRRRKAYMKESVSRMQKKGTPKTKQEVLYAKTPVTIPKPDTNVEPVKPSIEPPLSPAPSFSETPLDAIHPSVDKGQRYNPVTEEQKMAEAHRKAYGLYPVKISVNKKKIEYDYSPRGEWRREKGKTGKWEKVPKDELKTKSKVTKKKATKKKSLLSLINAPKLVKDSKGNLVSPAVIKADENLKKKKLKEQKIIESWM
jgi:hypothetical protein